MRIRKPSVRSERIVGGLTRVVRLSIDRTCRKCGKTLIQRSLAVRKAIRPERDKIAYRVEFYCELCVKKK